MIKSFRHKGLGKFFETGSTAGVQPGHAKKLRMVLAALDTAQNHRGHGIPGFALHPLKGEMLVRLDQCQLATDVRVPGWERLRPGLRGLPLMAMHTPPHPGEFINDVYLVPHGVSGRACCQTRRGDLHPQPPLEGYEPCHPGNGTASFQGDRPQSGELTPAAGQPRSLAGASACGSQASGQAQGNGGVTNILLAGCKKLHSDPTFLRFALARRF